MAFKAALANPNLWDGEVTQLSIVRLFTNLDQARSERETRGDGDQNVAPAPGTLKVGAIVLTPVLHYVVEFLDASNPAGGFKIVSEDVVECITDVTVHQDYHDGQCASYLFEMRTFGSIFAFCVWDYRGEGEGMRSEAAKRASRKLGKAFQSLPCVSFKNDYLGDALDSTTSGATDSASPEPPTMTPPKGALKVQPVHMMGSLESLPLVPSLTTEGSNASPSPARGALLRNESSMATVSQLSASHNSPEAMAFVLNALVQQHNMLMAEAEGRNKIHELQSTERESFLLSLSTAWHTQVDHGKLTRMLEEMKQLHTTIDTYELFDPVDAESSRPTAAAGGDSSPSGGRVSTASRMSQSFGTSGGSSDASPASPSGGGLRKRLSFKFAGGPTIRMALFTTYATEDAKRLASEIEKVARQKCHKYYTGQQKALVEKRHAMERDLNGKHVREATAKFEEERTHLHSQPDLAVKELRRLKALSERLSAELSNTQKREQSVLERSRKREQELASFTSPPGQGGCNYSSGKAPSMQQETTPSQGRGSGFNFFASTPQ